MSSSVGVGAGPLKSVRCSLCNKNFSRSDHLKRHQLRHSGVKPYSCVFCSESFTRSDNLRDHYPTCSQRRNRTIPEAARGGRRSHACDSCTSMKLRCDGKDPCKTCRQKRIECKFSRAQAKESSERGDCTSPSPSLASGKPQNEADPGFFSMLASRSSHDSHQPPSDRGSIQFLLNSGTASFIECFRFPSSNERRNILNFKNTSQETSNVNVLGQFRNWSDNGSSLSDSFEDEPIDWSLFEDENLLRFLSSPLSDVQIPSDDLFGPMFMDSTLPSPPGLIASMSFLGEWEPASVQSAALVQVILDKATLLQIEGQERIDVSQCLNFLFTPTKIEKLCSHYFEFWHPHCPLLHKPSFNIATSPIPLLMSVALMGAMYSPVDKEVSSAKVLLDLAELYIYSVDDLTEEFEIRQMLRGLTSSVPQQAVGPSPLAFLHLQAAYLMVCVQFWAGNIVAKKRAAETRYSVVVKLARKLGLTRARHELQDSVDESLWIQKECQIRTINIMTLLDCAFSFFANFPCRLSVSEMKFDLPCEEYLFAASRPFSDPKFSASRHLTTYDAFQSLFGSFRSASSSTPVEKGNPLGLNPMDMFILIHLLYVYTHTHITLFSSTLNPSPGVSGSTSPSAPVATDSSLVSIKNALSRWRSLWTTVRSNISSNAWANLGFYRNGYNYWLVTQLLITNKGSVDLMNGMEVGCEDTLTHLKSLLRDTGNDS